MVTIQEIHANLMDAVNTAVENAEVQLSQISPDGENGSLNLVIDIAAIELDPITGDFLPTVRGFIYDGWRNDLANSAAALTVAVSTAPALSSHPGGLIGADYVRVAAKETLSNDTQGLSVN